MRHAEVFQAVGQRYRHILVDGWQDTNAPQYEIIVEIIRADREAQQHREQRQRFAQRSRAREVARPRGMYPETWPGYYVERVSAGVTYIRQIEPHTATAPGPQIPRVPPPPPLVFVVGDTDQCIYAFRGADFTNVARFEEDFVGCQTVFLQENYWSTANIVRAATAVIEKVFGRAEQSTIAATVVQVCASSFSAVMCLGVVRVFVSALAPALTVFSVWLLVLVFLS